MVNKEQVLGLIRHSLTFVGGCLVANGILTESMSADIVGSCMALIGTIWSIMVK
jgi:hypothetical protein